MFRTTISFRTFFSLFFFFVLTWTVRAVDNTWDYSVQLGSTVTVAPPAITLSWPQDTNGTPASYEVSRKLAGGSVWGPATALAGSATHFTDTNVALGTAYEYRVVKKTSGYAGYGYIQTGIDIPLRDARGTVVLLVDASMSAPLISELARLEQDLAGDGWKVQRHDVSRAATPATVKALIQADYAADPANVKAVFLLGHIPVPYSGQLNPDGHGDHMGAWPADVFYGDMDGDWTDWSVAFVQATHRDPADNLRLTNLPGDGKFDQSQIPSEVELQVGRVDLANMPGDDYWGVDAVIPSETELLRRYLNKDHAFRHRISNPTRRALVADYLGAMNGQAPAASAFRSFAPLVGASQVRNLTREVNGREGVFIEETSRNDYLLVSGSAYAGYGAIHSLGSAGPALAAPVHEFIARDARGVFTLMFGSWHGDWDHPDNVLRAPLATNHGLVSVWSGRPHWFLHPLGQGETIGAAARLTQNNGGLYQTQQNASANRIHIALMGDPTLRLHPVAPVSELTGTALGGNRLLAWTASPDTDIVGYHVYRGDSRRGPFTRLTLDPAIVTNFVAAADTPGAIYQVRAVKRESTPSGTYFNSSQGVFWSASDGAAPVKIVGAAREVGSDIRHPNGNTYDQILLEGTSATVTADSNQITRISFVDLTDDIVQVEFSGAGQLTVSLTNASGPTPAANYRQPTVAYMKGHARLAITGADASTYLAIFSVGKITAINQAIFRDDVTYDGIADVASLDIASRNGAFGGVLAGNAHFFATDGQTGVIAPNVTIGGALVVGDVTAKDSSRARLAVGHAADVRIAGGNLWPDNGSRFGVSGISVMRMTDGMKSTGLLLPVQNCNVSFDVLDGTAWPVTVR